MGSYFQSVTQGSSVSWGSAASQVKSRAHYFWAWGKGAPFGNRGVRAFICIFWQSRYACLYLRLVVSVRLRPGARVVPIILGVRVLPLAIEACVPIYLHLVVSVHLPRLYRLHTSLLGC